MPRRDVSSTDFESKSAPSRMQLARAVSVSLLRDIGTEEHTLSLERAGDAPASSFAWVTATPQRIMSYYCKESEHYQLLLTELWTRCPNTWNLVLYTDEISPGAILRPIVKKKSYVWYVSLLELRGLLYRTDVWMPIAILRSSIVKRLAGGLSEATRILLRSMFLGPAGLCTAGFCFRTSVGRDVIVDVRMG